MSKYYAVKSKQGEYLGFYYSGKYETTDVNKSELNIYNAQDILFSNYEELEYELESLKYDHSYNLEEGVAVGDIVELDIEFNFKEV